MEWRDNMVGCNDKIVLENQLNAGECRNFEYRQSKSDEEDGKTVITWVLSHLFCYIFYY
jgi:hypothetical protein